MGVLSCNLARWEFSRLTVGAHLAFLAEAGDHLSDLAVLVIYVTLKELGEQLPAAQVAN